VRKQRFITKEDIGYFSNPDSGGAFVKKKSSHPVFGNITIGLQLAITILIFVYAGYWLDSRYGKSPLFLALGALLGMIIGFYNLIKTVESENRRMREDENKDDEKRIKWR
jgi:F0F1-type ATP synthase assembly protein I